MANQVDPNAAEESNEQAPPQQGPDQGQQITFDALPKQIQQILIQVLLQGKQPTAQLIAQATQELRQNPQLIVEIAKKAGFDIPEGANQQPQESMDYGTGDEEDGE